MTATPQDNSPARRTVSGAAPAKPAPAAPAAAPGKPPAPAPGKSPAPAPGKSPAPAGAKTAAPAGTPAAPAGVNPALAALAAARVVRAAEATVVKPLYPATRLLKGGVFEAEKAAAAARKVLEDARAEADAIRQAARADAQAVRDEAFRTGFDKATAEVEQVLANFRAELDGLKGQFAKDVQRLAFKVARVILNVEFQLKPERVADLVAAVVAKARLYNRVTVSLHPDDLEHVRPLQAALAKQLAFAKEVALIPDPDLPPHGVRVDTEMGAFDGTVETQLRKLEAHVLGKPASAPADDAPDQGPTGNPI